MTTTSVVASLLLLPLPPLQATTIPFDWIVLECLGLQESNSTLAWCVQHCSVTATPSMLFHLLGHQRACAWWRVHECMDVMAIAL
jgi:hypothetical protein